MPGEYPTGTYRFEWEREWRSIGDFRFTARDVAFLILPEMHHVLARDWFRAGSASGIVEYFGCPFIDSTWSLEQIRDSINAGWIN